MSKVVANMIVSFGGDVSTDAKAIIELDGVANNDVTSFSPGDTVNFLINYDTARLSLMWVKATSGNISMAGQKVENRVNQNVLWLYSTDKKELSYIPAGSLTPTWFGNEAAGIKLTEISTVAITGGILPAICHIAYPVSFVMGRLFTPSVTLADEETYPVTIVAHFEVK